MMMTTMTINLERLRQPFTVGRHTFTLPELRTLHRTPSWVNNRGRVDRSACIELRAGDLWRDIRFRDLRIHTFEGSRRKHARVQLYAQGAITLGARHIKAIADNRFPQQIAGDFRSFKANAMKPRRDERIRLPNVNRTSGENVNRGMCRSKLLGLTDAWIHTIRLERWRLHEKLVQHFLICPTTHRCPGRDDRTQHPEHAPWYRHGDEPDPPKDSTYPRESYKAPPGCCGKSVKLFMPLATEQEVLDADAARRWLAQTDTLILTRGLTVPLRLRHMRQALIARYEPLFDRRFVCRKCLGLRYGEVKRWTS